MMQKSYHGTMSPVASISIKTLLKESY